MGNLGVAGDEGFGDSAAYWLKSSTPTEVDGVVGADEVVDWVLLALSSVIDDLGSIGLCVEFSKKKLG